MSMDVADEPMGADSQGQGHNVSHRRALPPVPSVRGAQEWHLSWQATKGRHACCWGCHQRFEDAELRVARPADVRGNGGRYLHSHCLPGGFHPQDTFTGPATSDQQIQPIISALVDHALEPPPIPVDVSRLPNLPVLAGDAWWQDWQWQKAFEITCGTLIDVPPTIQVAYALAKDGIIQQCLEGGNQEELHWCKLSMFDHLVLNNRRPDEESQVQSVTRRLQQVTDGDWNNLWLEATSPLPIRAYSEKKMVTDQVSLIRDLIKAEETGRALKTLKPNTPPMRDPRRLPEVTALFPPPADGLPPAFSCDDEDQWTEEQVAELSHTIARRLRRPPRRTRAGLLGGRLEHWSVLKVLDGGLARAGKLLANFGLGYVPEPVIAAHARCELLLAEKTSGGLRPLQMGSVCRRIAMSAVCGLLRLEVQCAAGPDQLCTGIPDGCTKVYHAARTMCRQDVKRGICARDCKSAHQRLDRKYAARQLASRCPRLLQPFHVWYARSTDHAWRTAAGDIVAVTSTRGLDQGDPIANPVFAVSTAEAAENLRRDLIQHDPKTAVFQFADDVQVVTTTTYFAIVADSTNRHWEPAGLSFEPRKDQSWSLDPLPLQDQYWQSKRADRLRCLGPDLAIDQETDPSTPVAPDFENAAVGSDMATSITKVTKMATQLAYLTANGLPLQLAQHLLRVGTNNLTQHILAAKPISAEKVAAFDNNLRQAWQTLLELPLTDAAWVRGSLPMKEGGVGFGMIGPRAPAAYVSAWSRTWSYVAKHMGVDTATDLLSLDPGLATELSGAAAALRPLIPRTTAIPWEHGQTQDRKIRQGTLLQQVWRSIRTTLLDQMQSVAAPARLRSCGGPGAGGFLIAPADDSTWIIDVKFKIAVTRRLGGCLRPVAQGLVPTCHHSGRNGLCGAPLDPKVHMQAYATLAAM